MVTEHYQQRRTTKDARYLLAYALFGNFPLFLEFSYRSASCSLLKLNSCYGEQCTNISPYNVAIYYVDKLTNFELQELYSPMWWQGWLDVASNCSGYWKSGRSAFTITLAFRHCSLHLPHDQILLPTNLTFRSPLLSHKQCMPLLKLIAIRLGYLGTINTSPQLS